MFHFIYLFIFLFLFFIHDDAEESKITINESGNFLNDMTKYNITYDDFRKRLSWLLQIIKVKIMKNFKIREKNKMFI